MTSPKTPQQLVDAIETVVASYLDEVRRTVQHAVERSLSRSAATTRSNKSKVELSDRQRSTKTRRSAGALDELCDKLYQCVCARPGESSAVFADELGCTVPDLQRPMAKLKAQGRLRCAGQRNLMRYLRRRILHGIRSITHSRTAISGWSLRKASTAPNAPSTIGPSSQK